VITEDMVPLLEMVRAARTELVDDTGDSADRCARLLRVAEAYASDLPRRVVDDAGALRTVTAVRTELGTCLIAVDRLTDAGVADTIVTDVLRRGTTLAERVLTVAALGPETVGATP
jgi:hypothetical protein